jgi:hypothetical protein
MSHVRQPEGYIYSQFHEFVMQLEASFPARMMDLQPVG